MKKSLTEVLDLISTNQSRIGYLKEKKNVQRKVRRSFTLIELLVVIAQYCRKKVLNLTQQNFSYRRLKTSLSPNIPLFLKRR